ncbi:DNA polymerase I [Prochlorococcus marinus XMU1414]|uniref:DNA polymerase I n=1 Tax=Prochlorococcus marinus XMU1424 TaxID=2774497 RepID=A0A9D9BTR4_PROMR|nr:DNA polymerase I [Prochlorococcus marinus]MBO8228590.1 DNA polymerase I [Prochlorococcus marinus XMU1414]MBW3046067.1 DNA polymerase I [Prochlorococcus marinus str. MU1414]MCR8531640.1 DNA polymerase I [Prochlorococcus marinus XMU1420]MCR8535369.1 DNA polymerase I [Prochlorococcus marinus XMU1424]
MSLKSENSKKPILLLVDGHSLAFRSFYAFSKGIDGGLTTKEGFPTSVTYGFLKSLLDNCKNISPEGVCITFDTEKPTFRHELDPNYKANRDVAPDVFFQDIEQLEIILEESLNLPIFKSPGYEADDLLGTIANDASSKGWCVNILSGDRDLFQLVDDQKDIYVLYMGGGPYAKSGNPTLMNENGVKEKLGVAPERVVDLKALTGDSSDNIPGIKGVGPKTAINLLKENDTLDGIYQALDKIQQNNDKKYKGFIKGSVIEKLRNDKHNAFLSRDLAKINTEVPLILSNGYELKNINQELLSESLKKLELSTLLRQIDIFNSTFSKGGFDKNNVAKDEKAPKVAGNNELENSENKIPKINVTVVNDIELLDKLIQRLDKTNQIVSLDTETNSLNPIDAELVGIGLCLGEENDDLFYIPLGHQTKKETPNQLSIENVFSKLRNWIEDPKKEKALQNSKFDRQIFFNHGLDLKGVTFDTLLADYLLNNQEKHGLSEISFRLFGFKPPSFKETVGKNKDFSFVDIDEASIYCGYDVFLTFKIVKIFKESFSKEKDELIKLFEEIELPLEPVLSQMEINGITIDIPYLDKLSKELKSTLADIESKVYELAEESFNLSSPKQLGEILFEKLNLDKKKSRKTKTGWSTDAVVLERLVDEHEIIQHLIKHRTLSKLLSTYIDALPNLINEKTGRVHTNFNQAATATGRLSSSNPNLQNIPVRTEFSRRIRKAFLPEKNWKLLSADYSQIELRILAHLADEEILINAFHKNDDIHSLTARLIFEKEEISSDERRVGKTINFGVIYGMGIKKFARSTGVSTPEAKEFLIKYKERYSKIFKFLELQERLALSKGYVKTIFGRKREFKFDKNGLGRLIGKDPYEIDLQSARRAGMEAQSLRAAANAPIQGSSADIIKIAMVQLNKKFIEMNVPAKMLLQVHDELLFEVEPDSLEITTKLVKKTMEDCVKLNVPLLVDIGIGDNWMETK